MKKLIADYEENILFFLNYYDLSSLEEARDSLKNDYKSTYSYPILLPFIFLFINIAYQNLMKKKKVNTTA